MPNVHQQDAFRASKIAALRGLREALRNEVLPNRAGLQLTSGKIEEYFPEQLRPIQPRAILTVLREADVPHDSNNRFLAWTLHSHLEAIDDLFFEYTGLKRVIMPKPEPSQNSPTNE